MRLWVRIPPVVQWLESDVILGRLYEITFGYNVRPDGVEYEYGVHQGGAGVEALGGRFDSDTYDKEVHQ